MSPLISPPMNCRFRGHTTVSPLNNNTYCPLKQQYALLYIFCKLYCQYLKDLGLTPNTGIHSTRFKNRFLVPIREREICHISLKTRYWKKQYLLMLVSIVTMRVLSLHRSLEDTFLAWNMKSTMTNLKS